MQLPDIPHRVTDPKWKISITIWAYRKLRNEETAMYVRAFSRTHKLKKNSRYDVYTSVGCFRNPLLLTSI